jgi:hypothetical protein
VRLRLWGKNEGVYRQSEKRQYDVMRMLPFGPPRASTEKDTTVAGAETDTQGTPAKLGSVGERDQNSETDQLLSS